METEKQQDPGKKVNKRDPLLENGHKTIDEEYRIRNDILGRFEEIEEWFSAESKKLESMDPAPNGMVASLGKSLKKIQELEAKFKKMDLVDLIRAGQKGGDPYYDSVIEKQTAEEALGTLNRAIRSLRTIKAHLGEDKTDVHYKKFLKEEKFLMDLDQESLLHGHPSVDETIFFLLTNLEYYKNSKKEAMPSLKLECDPKYQILVNDIREQWEAEISTQRELLELEDGQSRDDSDPLKEKYLGILGEYEAQYRTMSDFRISFNNAFESEQLLADLKMVYDKYLEEKKSPKNASVKIENEPK